MDSGDNGDVFGWDTCTRRTWCNGEFKNSLPPTLLPIFKQMQTIAANGSGVTAITSDDYFALAAEKEVFGTNKYADSTVELNLFQFDWYKTASNRQKGKGSWSRSHYLESGFFSVIQATMETLDMQGMECFMASPLYAASNSQGLFFYL